MNRAVIVICLSLLHLIVFAQSKNAYDEAAEYSMKTGDYENAILILKKGLEIEPTLFELNKKLSFCYYFTNEYDKAYSLLKKLIKRDSADVQCYEILADIYKIKNKPKESEVLYRVGMVKFPSDGNMYNQLADLLWEQKKEEAIRYWEMGIKADPNFSKNYYNASNYYFFKQNYIWAIIYGEIFVNLESYTSQTDEIKKQIFESYQLLNNIPYDSLYSRYSKPFEKAYLSCIAGKINKEKIALNIPAIIMLRTKCNLNWFDKYSKQFPFKLMRFHQELLRNGTFEAYNQWLFGMSDSTSHQNWLALHLEEYNNFTNRRKLTLFKLPKSEYLHQ